VVGPYWALDWYEILLALRDLETWPLKGSLIDSKLGVNSTIWNVDQHNVEVGTSYGFSKHTKVVDIIALTRWVQAKVDHFLHHTLGFYKVSCINMP
jgi:hypothetical protein